MPQRSTKVVDKNCMQKTKSGGSAKRCNPGRRELGKAMETPDSSWKTKFPSAESMAGGLLLKSRGRARRRTSLLYLRTLAASGGLTESVPARLLRLQTPTVSIH
jgi:hypothetical protein